MRHFGLLIPATNTTCEIELGHLPGGLQAHFARCGRDGPSPFHPSLDADIAYQSKMLADARVELIMLIQTSASLFDEDYDAVTIRRITDASGLPAFTSAQAVGQALQAFGAKRIAFATPYSPEVIGLATRYYERNYGMTVIAGESLGAADAYAIGKMDAEMVTAAFKRIDRPEIDVLVVPGGNFPTMHRVAAWEATFGKPVLTTNQALLWAVLRAMEIVTPIRGRGRLLETMLEA